MTDYHLLSTSRYFWLLLTLLPKTNDAWGLGITNPRTVLFSVPNCRTTQRRLSKQEEYVDTTSTINLVECGNDEVSIREAATFMMDAFWLGSSRQCIPSQHKGTVQGGCCPVSDAARMSLIETQTQDFLRNYGARLGQRLLQTGILQARDRNNNNELLGLVCLSETILDITNPDQPVMMSVADAESLLKNTVAALPPKQRREYKNASARDITSQLLFKDTQRLVCCLSNLAVAPSARRRGVGMQLCTNVQETVADILGYDDLHLLVEATNDAARRLYEMKLGYKKQYTLSNDVKALRVDLESGSFVETEQETLVLVKHLK